MERGVLSSARLIPIPNPTTGEEDRLRNSSVRGGVVAADSVKRASVDAGHWSRRRIIASAQDADVPTAAERRREGSSTSPAIKSSGGGIIPKGWHLDSNPLELESAG